MDDLACPRCKTTKYRNPSLKLLVNTCGHALCDNCVELLFVKGSGNCPECQIPLRRSGFRVQLFEDPAVEKEVEIRKRVLRDYNKHEEDFETLREYNDYLEQVETIIFNLVNNIDILETNKMVEQYKKENKEQISKSRHKKNAELLELETILEQEAHRTEIRRLESLASHKEEKMRKLKNREALIDDLMFLESDAKSIVEQHKAASAAATQESAIDTNFISSAPLAASAASLSGNNNPLIPGAAGGTTMFTSGIGIGIGGGGSSTTFLPVPKAVEVPLFKYEPSTWDIGGPNPPTLEDLLSGNTSSTNAGLEDSFLSHIRAANEMEIAGGYHHVLACRRALQDAFMDIAMQPKLLGAASAPKMEIMDTS